MSARKLGCSMKQRSRQIGFPITDAWRTLPLQFEDGDREFGSQFFNVHIRKAQCHESSMVEFPRLNFRLEWLIERAPLD